MFFYSCRERLDKAEEFRFCSLLFRTSINWNLNDDEKRTEFLYAVNSIYEEPKVDVPMWDRRKMH